ncbi:MAG: hypothetical protein GXP59_10625, partial [Deltaproteobacteria bacterium]|nr:hypothetical protein [Deltaproteobacteria bacterium]
MAVLRIALDGMGGELGPAEMVAGAVAAVREYGHHVTILGDREQLQAAINGYSDANLSAAAAHRSASCSSDSLIDIVHTSQVVGMEESPLEALRRKKDSSVLVAFKLLKKGEVD